MSGGAPIPVKVKERGGQLILNIKDLEIAGSAKMSRVARGEMSFFRESLLLICHSFLSLLKDVS